MNILRANYAFTFLLFVGMLYDFGADLVSFASTLEGPLGLDGGHLLRVLGLPLFKHLVVAGLAPVARFVLVSSVVSKLTNGLLC
jgi:hypothetical protein